MELEAVVLEELVALGLVVLVEIEEALGFAVLAVVAVVAVEARVFAALEELAELDCLGLLGQDLLCPFAGENFERDLEMV